MRIPSLVLVGMLLPSLSVAQPVNSQPPRPQLWQPNLADIQKAETGIGSVVNFGGWSCPATNMSEFARYYIGITQPDGSRAIKGQFILVKNHPNYGPTGVHIGAGGFSDGGCSIANVWFDAASLKITHASWGGR